MATDRRDMRLRLFLTSFLESTGRTINDNESAHYTTANNEAEVIIDDPSAIETMLAKVKAKALCLGEDLNTMCDMAEMHIKKKWTLDRFDLVLIVSCLVYVATPVDAIPDAIPIVGYTDDALIVSATSKTIFLNMAKFRQWKRRNEAVFKSAKDESCCDCAIQ